MDWTAEQAQAIEYQQEGELLISAAAGSGKTAVLTERIMQLALKQGISPERLIVLTFTDKAASNMKQRLEKKVKERRDEAISKEERDALQKLKEQVPLAQISTIHSFCLRIIREYKHLLCDQEGNLLYPKNLRTLDSNEKDLLLNDALGEVLAGIYQKRAEYLADSSANDPIYEASYASFLRMQNISGSQKNDEPFRKDVLAFYEFLRSLPDYRLWLEKAYTDLEKDSLNIAGSPELAYLLEQLDSYLIKAEAALPYLESLPYFSTITTKETAEAKAFQENFPALKTFILEFRKIKSEDIALENLSSPARADIWDLAVEYSRIFTEWSPLRAAQKDLEKMEFRAFLIKEMGPLLAFLGGKYGSSDAGKEYGLDKIKYPLYLKCKEFTEYAPAMLSLVRVYLDLLLLLDKEFLRMKQERSLVDFADYEHLAYELTRNPEVQDVLSKAYLEILIDEYQDTSPLQEALLKSLGCKRMTMLGDLKQSIYRFRHADPSIFNKKLKTYSLIASDEENTGGELLLLNKNFRSQARVLHAINSFFASFLRRDTGELDYDESQALQAGRADENFPERALKRPAMKMVFAWEEENEEEIEARFNKLSAAQISLYYAYQELLASGYKPQEIAILARTHNYCKQAEEALANFAIKANLKEKQVFLKTPEQRILKDLVDLLSNFQQDLPLLGILRSPFMGESFDEEELYRIARCSLPLKQKGEKSFFYEHFLIYAEEGEDSKLREKVLAFLEEYRERRRQATYLSLAKLLRRIIEASDWQDRISRQLFASDRLDDYNRFLEMAENYGRNHPQDLLAFSRYLEQVASHDLSIEQENDDLQYKDRPQIITMHSAKGLEFKAVIYYSAFSEKNEDSSNTSIFMNAEKGIAANYPLDEYRELLSPRRVYFAAEETFQERAEAYRLLYVCLTRAEECLVICDALKKTKLESALDKVEQALEESSEGKLAKKSLDRCKSDGELLLAWRAVNGERPFKIREELTNQKFYRSERDSVELFMPSLPELQKEIKRYESISLDTQREDQNEKKMEPSLASSAFSAVDFPLFPENATEIRKLESLLREELPGDELLGIPAKISVSEIQENSTSDAGVNIHRESTMLPALREMALQLRLSEKTNLDGGKGLSASAYGSFLHSIFQRLNPRDFMEVISDENNSSRTIYQVREDAEQIYAALIEEQIKLESLAQEHKALALEAWGYVDKFLRSALGARLADAERKSSFVARELPFTLRLPLNEFVDAGTSIESTEFRLVQGMIDLFFDEAEHCILVDYKTDHLGKDPAENLKLLQERYNKQIEIYAQAIERLRGKEVKERYIWAVREGKAYPM